jgi:citrate synthase
LAKSLEEVIAGTFRISPAKVTDALAFNAIPEWDSLAHMELMLALEAAYGVSIDEDHMIELTSVGAIRSFLKDGRRGA